MKKRAQGREQIRGGEMLVLDQEEREGERSGGTSLKFWERT